MTTKIIKSTHADGDTPAHSSVNGITLEANGTLATVPPEVAKIRQLHGELMDAARRTVPQAIHIGELLAGLKKKVGHGQWEAFVAEHLKLEIRTVQNYMRLHREKDRLKYETVSDFPLAKAYLVLREPTSTSPSRKPRTVQKPAAPAPDPEGGTEPNSQPESLPAQDLAMDVTDPDGPVPDVLTSPGAVIVTDVPSADVPATATTKGKPRHVADQFDLKFPESSAPGEIVPDDDQVSFKFLDGTTVTGWQDGVVCTEKLERELRRIANLPVSVLLHQRLAQQQVFAAGACAINQLCDPNPDDGTLKAIESALLELRNAVVMHNNYRP